MEISFVAVEPQRAEADLVAIAVFGNSAKDSKSFVTLDASLGGLLTQAGQEEHFEGREHQRLLLHTGGRIPSKRVLVFGLGKRESFEVPDTRRYGAAIASAARKARAKVVVAVLPPVDAGALDLAAQFLTEGVILGAYRFDKYLTADRKTPSAIKALKICRQPNARRTEKPPYLPIARARAIAEATCLARDLVNEPPSDLTPVALADRCKRLVASEVTIQCQVLGPKECARERMGLFLAVAKGSPEAPRFIHLSYRPRGKRRPQNRIVLIGKGVTFDSGGLSLKPTDNMLDMKSDMAGAAAVISLLRALPSLGIRSEVHALIAATENMISGSAYKLGDIVVGMGGKSVEIVNTDAEGRLTLADALTYAVRKLKPTEIIDVATLTGACMVALGPSIAGVMGNDPTMLERFLAAARRAGEPMWQLPLPRDLKGQLKSKIADLKNSGKRWGGALTAGLFLQEFVGETPWVHVDIAGPSFSSKAEAHIPSGGTGFAVATLLEYILSREPSRP